MTGDAALTYLWTVTQGSDYLLLSDSESKKITVQANNTTANEQTAQLQVTVSDGTNSMTAVHQITITEKGVTLPPESIPAYTDIKSILNAINKPKNIICMLPYEYVIDEHGDIELLKKEVIKTISADYRSLVDYRMKIQSGYENYVAFVFENNLFVLQFNKSSVDVTDIIPVTKSKIFCQLRSVAKAF